MARKCGLAHCGERYFAKGYCKAHYARSFSGARMDTQIRKTPRRPLNEWGPWYVNNYGYRFRRRRVGTRVYEYQTEHKLVMQEKLGRDLYPDEEIHHINGVKTDNRPENLELWSTSQPSGQRIEDKIAWAREILARYEAE